LFEVNYETPLCKTCGFDNPSFFLFLSLSLSLSLCGFGSSSSPKELYLVGLLVEKGKDPLFEFKTMAPWDFFSLR
jgi:hypothetical protein